MKSNSNGSVIRTFTGLGSGSTSYRGANSRARWPPGRLREDRLLGGREDGSGDREALRRGILMFNVESREELETIDAVAGKMRKRAPIAIRVNPDVDPKTHPYISTGLKKNKFGIRISQAMKDYEWAAGRRHIEVVGVDCHIGSQLTDVAPFVDAAGRVRRLVDRLLRKGFPIRFVDIGGGWDPVQRRTSPGSGVYAAAVARRSGPSRHARARTGSGPRRKRGDSAHGSALHEADPVPAGRGRSTSSSSTPP